MNSLGYIVLDRVLRAQDYGAPHNRDRYYLLGFLVGREGLQQKQCAMGLDGFPVWWHYAASLLRELQIEPLPISRFLLPVGDERLQRWAAAPAASSAAASGGGSKLPKKDKGEKVYDVDHLQAYGQADLEWPPQFSEEFQKQTGHLTRRMQEIIWYHMHLIHKGMAGSKKELPSSFMDINYSISWARMVEDRVPCLVGSSRIWCFSPQGNDVALQAAGRDMAGEEALALQGFSIQAQNPAVLKGFMPKELMDLAGNAFNGAVCAAVVTVLLSCCPWSLALEAQQPLDCDSAHPGSCQESSCHSESDWGWAMLKKAPLARSIPQPSKQYASARPFLNGFCHQRQSQ
jgi:site-specific DNA-cytosine methylase